MLKTFIHKPEPFQAIQWTEDNLEEIREYIGYGHRDPRACAVGAGYELVIDTTRGWWDSWLRVQPGGYIWKSEDGFICGCDQAVFEKHWEEVR